MDIDRIAWRFVNLKHWVRDGADFEGRFFGTDRSEHKEFFEEARQELVGMEVPDYDEKNPDLLTLYFVFASALYLVYDLFSLKNSCYEPERDELACRVRESVERTPLRSKVSRSDFIANEFGIIDHSSWDKRLDSEKPCKWLHHEDAWLDGILWSFKKFVDTGKVPKMELSAFLWLFLKYYRYSLPVSFENYDIVSDKFFDSLAAYCSYARSETKLMENINNYALNLFADIKERGLPFERGLRKITYCTYRPINIYLKKEELKNLESLQKEAKEAGQDFETYFEFYQMYGSITPELDCEKSNLLTTVRDNEEFADLLKYHNIVKGSERGYNPLYNSLLVLTNKALDCGNIKQEDLLNSIQTILNQDITFLKKWPFLTMLCYMMVHYLEEEELLQLFKKPVDEDKNAFVFKDIRECPGLQCLFFFALFGMSNGSEEFSRSGNGENFLAALKRGDWFEPAVQSELFTDILKRNGINGSITADEMSFDKYVDKRFCAMQSVLNLVYNVACYSESKTILNITQQINNIGEHRDEFVYPNVKAAFANEPEKKGRNWKKTYTKSYVEYPANEQKKMRRESDKMREIDSGILLPEYIQQVPECGNQYFSRNFEMKIFLQTDVSCVPDDDDRPLQRRDYHLRRNRRMLECGYLYYARNMTTHNVDLLYTKGLLETKHYPDLLRILYTLMRQMQKDCSLSPSDKEKPLFEFEHSSNPCNHDIFASVLTSYEKNKLEEAIEKRQEMDLLNTLKFYESRIEKLTLDKDSEGYIVEIFQYLADLHGKLEGQFSPNVEVAAAKVSETAREKILAMQKSYDAVSYDLFKNEPDYGSPFLKECIYLLLQVIQCVTSTDGVVDRLKEKSEFNEEGKQRPLLNSEGDVTFEGMGENVVYPDDLVKKLRNFLDTVFGMENLRQSKDDRINRNVFHLYGYKIMLYLMKVTLQMTRLDLRALHAD